MPLAQVGYIGHVHDWGQVAVNIFGQDLLSISKVSYSEKSETKPFYGKGNRPIGYGQGNISYEASISIESKELQGIIDVIPSKSLLDIPPFDVIITRGDGVVNPIKTITLLGCKFTQVGVSHSQGDTNTTVDLPLFVMSIQYS